jgi:ribosomal protein L7/L12
MADSEADIEERLEWLERAVTVLASTPGAPALPPRPGADRTEVPQEVIAFVEAGQEIKAIHAYRKATGAGLEEAKAEIDRLRLGS